MLRDVTAAFLFAGSSSSEAERVSQSHRHTERTLTWPVTQTAIEKALPSTANMHSTHIKHKHSPLLLLLFGWQSQKVTIDGAHTHIHSRFTRPHTFGIPPSNTGTARLCIQQPCPDPSPFYPHSAHAYPYPQQLVLSHTPVPGGQDPQPLQHLALRPHSPQQVTPQAGGTYIPALTPVADPVPSHTSLPSSWHLVLTALTHGTEGEVTQR